MSAKTTAFIPLVVAFMMFFTGCQSAGLSGPAALPETNKTTPSTSTAVEDKQGDTTLTGSVSSVQTTPDKATYFLQTGQEAVAIDSYNLTLSDYVGKGTVKVTGQYSGDTLFITKIESQ